MLYLLILLSVAYCQTTRKIPSAGDPPSKRAFTSMVLLNNTLIVTSGQQLFGSVFDDIWEYDLETEAWEQLVSATNTLNRISYAAKRYAHGSFAVPSEGLVCVFGGKNRKGPLSDVWCFDKPGLKVHTK